MFVTISEMVDPDGSINKNHDYNLVDLRLGMLRNAFSVPPSLARRLLLSLAIKDSRPSLTREVFSLIPVKRDAFSRILSSMFSVVLMHIMMHHLCILVYFILNHKWNATARIGLNRERESRGSLIKYVLRHAGEYDLQDVGNVARYVQGCSVVEQCRSNCRGHGVRSDQHDDKDT